MQRVQRSQRGLPTFPGRETHRLNLSLRRAAVAALVVLAAVLFGGGAAQAAVLVNNIGQTALDGGDLVVSPRQHLAQGFTTGSSPVTLTSIEIRLDAAAAMALPPTVTVTTLGAEFLRDVTGTCTAADFPTMDETVTLAWQQTQQNFVIAEGAAPTGPANRAGTPGVGYLENPGPNSFQSGIGVLSGWVCEGTEVVIELNGQPQPAAYGTERLDTESMCGDTANGFGLLFNWNLLGEGEHEVVAVVDGEELGRATVRVTTVGAEFVLGAEGECVVEDFPMLGETVTLEWQQNSQNFVITDME